MCAACSERLFGRGNIIATIARQARTIRRLFTLFVGYRQMWLNGTASAFFQFVNDNLTGADRIAVGRIVEKFALSSASGQEWWWYSDWSRELIEPGERLKRRETVEHEERARIVTAIRKMATSIAHTPSERLGRYPTSRELEFSTAAVLALADAIERGEL